MTLRATILHAVAGLMFERPTRGLDHARLRARIVASQAPFQALIAAKGDTTENRTMLAHIIGVERWSQARVRQLLQTGVVFDEMDEYVPSAAQPYADLVALAGATRQVSVETLDALAAAGVPVTQTIAHNQFGALSVGGWSQYFVMHANLEAKKMR